MRELCAYAWMGCQLAGRYYESFSISYHGTDIRVRHSIKLLELELIIWPNVDVSSPILSGITVLRRREH